MMRLKGLRVKLSTEIILVCGRNLKTWRKGERKNLKSLNPEAYKTSAVLPDQLNLCKLASNFIQSVFIVNAPL